MLHPYSPTSRDADSVSSSTCLWVAVLSPQPFFVRAARRVSDSWQSKDPETQRCVRRMKRMGSAIIAAFHLPDGMDVRAMRPHVVDGILFADLLFGVERANAEQVVGFCASYRVRLRCSAEDDEVRIGSVVAS